MAICFFTLFSCGKSDTLFDILSESVAKEENLPVGSILAYGHRYEKCISLDSISDILGLDGYREFAQRIEDFALFSTLGGEYMEVALIRLYNVDDARTAKMLFERRLEDIKRATAVSKRESFTENGFVEIKGNTVALYVLPNECEIIDKVKKRI